MISVKMDDNGNVVIVVDEQGRKDLFDGKYSGSVLVAMIQHTVQTNES